MSRLRRALARQEGMALAMVVGLILILATISIVLIEAVVGETTRSAHAVSRQAAFQAAEAGIDDYTSKLVENHTFHQQYVAAGESTRRAPGGQQVSPALVAGQPSPSQWTYGTSWTYPAASRSCAACWRPLPNGYEYNLQIVPQGASSTLAITATGRPQGDADVRDWRQVQTLIRPANLTDYYRVVNGDVGFSSVTTTNGQIYANGNVSHDGTATASIWATGTIATSRGGQVNLQNNAKAYPRSPALDFNKFLASLTDVKAAADAAGTDYNASIDAWQLVFAADGTYTVWKCTRRFSSPVEQTQPTCTQYGAARPVPATGAIYSPQTVIVSGTVKGRVTVASANNVDVAGNISYLTPGQDVLGLIAQNDLYVVCWAPTSVSWSAAVLAETGTWQAYDTSCSVNHTTMTFTGSATTKNGGDFSAYTSGRTFNYDRNLEYLPPPFFPSLTDSYTTLLFRELPPS